MINSGFTLIDFFLNTLYRYLYFDVTWITLKGINWNRKSGALFIVNWNHSAILAKAEELSANKFSVEEVARSCFEWVRDNIKHIDDYNIQTVSCSASEVIQSGSGICYAKSHLLAGLLRANDIPTGFCYQRLSMNNNGDPYCLHALNAAYLPAFGWYRVDSRGNKYGINAQFRPPTEQLAYSAQLDGEKDFRSVLAEPLPIVIDVLTRYKTKDELFNNLPDAKSI